MSALFKSRISFVVPATSGNYAPQRLYLCPPDTNVAPPGLLSVTALVESLAATSVIELWLLKIGGDPSSDASFFYSGQSMNALGETTWPLASYPGAQIRVKSGGTAGTTVVDATAD